MPNGAYCHRCGKQLPLDAAFCPSCGHPVWQPKKDFEGAEVNLASVASSSVVRKRIALCVGVVVIFTLVGFAWYVHLMQVRKAAEASASRSAHELSQRIDQLLSAQLALSALGSKINSAGNDLMSDFAQASAASQRRHDNLNIFAEADEAQGELSYVKKAQTAEAVMENLETQDCAQWQALYGLGAARPLCSDFASTNEARENQITEWLRAVNEIVDNFSAFKSFKTYPYSNNEIVSHYTNAEAAATSADKFRKLGLTDGANLVTHLQNDISKTRARRSAVLAEYPHLPRETYNP